MWKKYKELQPQSYSLKMNAQKQVITFFIGKYKIYIYIYMPPDSLSLKDFSVDS